MNWFYEITCKWSSASWANFIADTAILLSVLIFGLAFLWELEQIRRRL